MKQEKKDFKEKIQQSVLSSGEFYVKLCFTILFATIFIVAMITGDGYRYFYSTIYGNEFQNNQFQIHTIDVGKGDCILLKLPTNQTMLIDTGEEEYSLRVQEYIKQFMIAENVEKIDYFVISHPDSDHIGGALNLIKNFKIENLLRPPVKSKSECEAGLYKNYDYDDSVIYDELIKYAYDNNLPMHFVSSGLSWQFAGCKIDCLSPNEGQNSTSNNNSVVLMVEFLNKKFLFMGDCESGIERKLVADYGDFIQADVLKVSHHGSNTSSSQEFLEAVKPKYALICTDGSSSYFPSKTVISRLEGVGAEILSTAKLGTIILSIENGEVAFSSAKRGANYVSLVFACLLVVVLVMWENPTKKLIFPKIQKKVVK